MKIAVVSDTHDNFEKISWLIDYLNEREIKTCLHCGDLINPGGIWRFLEHYRGELHLVPGNNDGERAVMQRMADENPEKFYFYKEGFAKLELAGKKIFMIHDSALAIMVAQGDEFDYCLGGHDHQFRRVEYGKTVFINPGNMVIKDKYIPREVDFPDTLAILDLESGEVEFVTAE